MSELELKGQDSVDAKDPWWQQLAMMSVIALAISASSALIINRVMAPNPEPTFATVDVGSVISNRQMMIMSSFSGMTNAQASGMIPEEVNAMRKEARQALSQIRNECNCILFAKGAIVEDEDDPLPDYTDRLSSLMGITPAALARAQIQIQQSLMSNPQVPAQQIPSQNNGGMTLNGGLLFGN